MLHKSGSGVEEVTVAVFAMHGPAQGWTQPWIRMRMHAPAGSSGTEYCPFHGHSVNP